MVIVLSTGLAASRGQETPDGLTVETILGPVAALSDEIPSPSEVMGVGIGQRHWYHHEILEYLDALAAASPRVRGLGMRGRSHGGRPLIHYAISAEANLDRLDAILAQRSRLADPDAGSRLEEVPIVVFMGASVHGDEPSGANAMPLVAWYLAASRDAEVAAQLDSVIILLNPVLNPDGFDRFAHRTNSLRGDFPSADPEDDEHRQSFVTGRTNYYWFDLNRDWLAHQHPESQSVVSLFQEWLPNLQLDFHEMGSDATYFFQPGVPERTHPLTPGRNQELTREMARFFQDEFDRDGTLYFSEERFDDYYMGKASTYADLFGCVGLLFEQASSRGAWQETVNGRLTFPLTIANQFRIALAAVRGAAALRPELLDYQRQAFADGLKAGQARGGWYLATADGDPGRLAEFVRVLRGHGIEVASVSETVEQDGQRFPAGESIAVPLAQPRFPYLESLWERRTEFEEAIFYDVSAWTLPLAFNLRHTVEPVAGVRTGKLPENPGFRAGRTLPETGLVGCLIDWRDSAVPALLAELHETGALVRVATQRFRAKVAGTGEMDFEYGTLLVTGALGETLPDEVRSVLARAAGRGLPVHGVLSSSTSVGIDLGSREFRILHRPSVLLVTGPGINQYEAGEIWHLFDQRIRMPLTMVEWTRLGAVDLRDYTHVILVGGSERLRFLGPGIADQIKSFVETGGILWAQGGAVEWAIDSGLAEGKWREAAGPALHADPGKGAVRVPPEPAERRPFGSAREDRALASISGAIVNANLDRSHPIGYGFSEGTLPVFRVGTRFLEPSTNAYATPLQYADEPVLAGYVSVENRGLLAGSAGMVIAERGKGRIVLALDAPAFRAYWWGTERLLVNAVFFGELLDTP